MRPYTKKSTICCATSRQTLATAGDGALSLEPEVLLLDVLDAVAAPGASPVLTAIIQAAETTAVPAVAIAADVAQVSGAPAVWLAANEPCLRSNRRNRRP